MDIEAVGTDDGSARSDEPVDMARWLRTHLEDALDDGPRSIEERSLMRAGPPSGETAIVANEELAAIRTKIDAFEATLQALPLRLEQQVSNRVVSLVENLATSAELRTIDGGVSRIHSDFCDGVLPQLKDLNQSVAALPTVPDPRVILGLRVLTEAVQALPSGHDPAILDRLAAQVREMRELLSQPNATMMQHLDRLTERVESANRRLADSTSHRTDELISRLTPIGNSVATLRRQVERMVPELHVLSQTINAAPASDPHLRTDVQKLTETVLAFPTGPDRELEERVEVLAARLHESPTSDPDVVAGLRALREVVEAVVEVVADLPATITRLLDARSDERPQEFERDQ